ncbi:MAG TPA: hypothetical protein VFX30_02235 [bacterium]|nr:hypothetical protein [bacterium]
MSFNAPFLCAPLLNAWVPYPSSGSLIVPKWNGSVTEPAFARRVMLDREGAQATVEVATRLFEDCENFRRYFDLTDHMFPQPLPQPAAGWMLQSYRGGNNQPEFAEATFMRSEDPRRVTIDLRNSKMATFEAGLWGETAEISQRVLIDRESWEVATGSYHLKAGFSDRIKALEFSALIATLIYECGQYRPDDELGALLMRPEGSQEEIPMVMKNGRFSFSGPFPSTQREILLVSALSVFETDDPLSREPVVTISVSKESEDKPSIVSALLYRPDNARNGRMPLHPRLQATLWAPLGQKAQKEIAPEEPEA